IAAGLERAFFDQQHLVAGGAEDFSRRPATGAAADDRDVRFEGQVFGQLRAVVGFPAAGHAFAERIGYGHVRVLLLFLEAVVMRLTPSRASLGLKPWEARDTRNAPTIPPGCTTPSSPVAATSCAPCATGSTSC